MRQVVKFWLFRHHLIYSKLEIRSHNRSTSGKGSSRNEENKITRISVKINAIYGNDDDYEEQNLKFCWKLEGEVHVEVRTESKVGQKEQVTEKEGVWLEVQL